MTASLSVTEFGTVAFEIPRSVQPGGYWAMIQKIWLMELYSVENERLDLDKRL